MRSLRARFLPMILSLFVALRAYPQANKTPSPTPKPSSVVTGEFVSLTKLEMAWILTLHTDTDTHEFLQFHASKDLEASTATGRVKVSYLPKNATLKVGWTGDGSSDRKTITEVTFLRKRNPEQQPCDRHNCVCTQPGKCTPACLCKDQKGD